MYVDIKNGRALFKQDDPDGTVWLRGSSFSLGVPGGTPVSRLAVEVPPDPQAVSFFVREVGPRDTRRERMALVLFYDDQGGKRVGIDINRSINSVGTKDIEQFNPFILSRDGVAVSNFETKTRYIDERMKELATPEPDWIVKTVSPDVILRYICKQIPLEELDAAATNEQRAQDAIAAERAAKVQFGDLADKLAHEVEGLRNTVETLYAEKEAAELQVAARDREIRRLRLALYFVVVRAARALFYTKALGLPGWLWHIRWMRRMVTTVFVWAESDTTCTRVLKLLDEENPDFAKI